MLSFSGGSRMKCILMLGVLLGTFSVFRHADAASPRQLVEITDFSSPVASPDGNRVAFRTERASIERNTYDTAWYVQDMDGSAPPRRVADGGVPLRDSAGISMPALAVWSPDGRWIYYRALLDGKIEVWRAAADGSGAEALTDDAADVRDFRLSPDGGVLKYSVGATREEVLAAEQAEYDRGIHVDETTPIGQNLFRSGHVEGRPATQRLGLIFNRVSLTSGVPDRWKAIDLVGGTRHDLASSDIPPSPPDPAGLVDGLDEPPWQLAREPQGGRIALLTRVGERRGLRSKPFVELAMLPGEGSRRLVECVAEPCTRKDITGIQWRPDSDEVVFTVTDSGQGQAQSIFRWDVRTGAVHAVAASRGMFAGEGRWSPGTCGLSRTALACVTAEAGYPPRLERVDLETGERKILFDPNAALARDMTGTPAQLLRWTDAEGRQFTGQFYAARGSGASPPPLFITYYRCLGFVRGGSGDEWPLATLAEHGISALCINAGPSGADAAERYDMGRSAVQAVIEWLASQGRIDGARVGMGGLSFGGEVTMWTLIHSDLIAAASIASPTSSQLYYLLGSNIGEEFLSLQHENWQLGPPGETPEQWLRLSPASNLHRIRTPILMQFPEQEYIHSLDYAIPLMRDRRADLYVFPHEPHNKFQPRHKLAAYERNLDWFRFWLQGHEDLDLTKEHQYRRWRTMRDSRDAPRGEASWISN